MPTTSSWASSTRHDAERFQSELRERLAKFRLELHPDKTRLHRASAATPARRSEAAGSGQAGDLQLPRLHAHLREDREREFHAPARHTMRKRMRAKLQRCDEELQRRRHQPIPEQGRWLAAGGSRVLRVPRACRPTSSRSEHSAREIIAHWHRALRRRSQRGRSTGTRMKRLGERWIPPARVASSMARERFDARTRGKSRVR